MKGWSRIYTAICHATSKSAKTALLSEHLIICSVHMQKFWYEYVYRYTPNNYTLQRAYNILAKSCFAPFFQNMGNKTWPLV